MMRRCTFGSTPGARSATKLTGESVRLILAELAKRAEVHGPVRLHGLRHVAVPEVLERSNGNIRAAHEFGRHSDMTTMRYDRKRRDLAGEKARLVAEGLTDTDDFGSSLYGRRVISKAIEHFLESFPGWFRSFIPAP
jgi:hypothetical protein